MCQESRKGAENLGDQRCQIREDLMIEKYGKRRCLTSEVGLEGFNEIYDDDISESSSTENNEQSDFVINLLDPGELTEEEDFVEDVLRENLEIFKNTEGHCRGKQYCTNSENGSDDAISDI
ncbi:hypothetical protein TNCV_1380491 [Trichonephila clavipes]|nr:hypothetical protein TNCV_1380491 [Trichonephila clavipes]